jgi:hypothetical protein
LFLALPLVLATEFAQDTVIRQDNVNFVFKKGLTLDFEIISQKLMVNNDVLEFNHQGGYVNFTIYKWGNNPKIGLYSNVPQQISLSFIRDEEEYYIKDVETGSYSKKTYLLQGGEEKNITFITFDEQQKITDVLQNGVVNGTEQKSGWMGKRLFFFRTPQIDGKEQMIVYIKNRDVVFVILGLSVVIALWMVFKR